MQVTWQQVSQGSCSKVAAFLNRREEEEAEGKQVPASGSLSNFLLNSMECDLSPEQSKDHHHVELGAGWQARDGARLLF